MVFCRSLLLLFGLMLLSGSSAQDADSLRSVWSDETQNAESRMRAAKAFYMTFVAERPQEILESGLAHYALAGAMADTSEMIYARNSRGHAYWVLGQGDSLLQELTNCKELAVLSDDTTWLAKILPRFGILHYAAGDYPAAMGAFMNGLELSQRSGDYLSQGTHLGNIGLIYFEVNASELAYQYYDSALWAYDKAEEVGLTSAILINMGLLENEAGNSQKALGLARRAKQVASDSNNRLHYAHSHLIMAGAFQELGQLDSAETYARKGLSISEEIGNTDFKVMNSINLIDLIIEREPQEAYGLADDIESMLVEMNNLNLLSKAYDLLYRRYKKSGNVTKALECKEMHLAFMDSLQLEEAGFQLVREALDEEYSSQMAKQEDESIKVQEELASDQRMKVIGVIMLCLAAIASLLWWMRKRTIAQQEEKNALLEELDKYKSEAPVLDTVTQEKPPLDTFHLDRAKIEERIGRQLNETDWSVLTLLAEDPVLANKEIAERAFISVDGIGSALRRMYIYFEVKESKYKKISLLLEAVKLSK